METLRKWLGMTTAPRLVAALAGPLTFVCGVLTMRGWMTGEQATWMVVTGLPTIVGAIYWLLAQTGGAVAERAAAQAPQATMDKLIEQKPQVALDGVEGMAGVRFIQADERYARANPNPNVIGPKEALDRLSQGGTSP